MFGRKKTLVRITMDETRYRIGMGGDADKIIEGLIHALADILNKAKKPGVTDEEVAEGFKEILLGEIKKLEAQTHGH